MSTWFRLSITMGVGFGALCAAACGTADGTRLAEQDATNGVPNSANEAESATSQTSTNATASGGPDDRAGQTGSPGAAECETDPDCDEVAHNYLSSVPGASLDGYRSRTCDQGNCRIIYTGAAGCSSDVQGPFFDCALDDAEIAKRWRAVVYPEQVACNPDLEAGTACPGSSQPAAAFFPRDPGEWQGMLIDSSVQPPCELSEYCGLARACVDGLCTRCTADSQCAQGEGCVLDHCVRQELIGCQRAADCGSGGLCLLSGYTGGTARGNEDMRAYCSGNGGGIAGSSGMAY
jgi:hypothetical protein